MKLIISIILLIGFTNLYSQVIVEKPFYASDFYKNIEDSNFDRLVFQTERDIEFLFSKIVSSDYDVRSHIVQADIDIKKGNLILALSRLNDLLKTKNNNPFIPFIHFKRASIYFEQGEFSWAEAAFREARITSKEAYSVQNDEILKELAHVSHYREAIATANKGSYSDAQSVFLEISEKYPGGKYSDDAIFALGQTSEIFFKYSEAIEYYQKVRTDYSYSNSYLLSLIREANNHLSLRNASSAISVLEKANTLRTHLVNQDSIGMMYEEQTGRENAQEQILFLRGEASNTAKNYEEALIYFDSFRETFNSSKLEYLVNLGTAWSYLNLKNYDKAIEFYDRIISRGDQEIWKASSIAKLYKVVALKLKGDIEKAQREMSKLAVRTDYPYLGEVLLELGQMYFEQEDWESARRTLERADRESSDALSTVRIKLLLGATYLQLLKWEKAIEAYNQSEKMATTSNYILMPKKDWYVNESRFKKAIAYIRSGKTALAIPSLAAFISEETDSSRRSEALFWLAESYYRSEMIKNSQQAYANLLSNYPRSERREDVLYGLGWTYFRQANYKKANSIFFSLIDEYPNSQYAIEVIARQADSYYMSKNYSKASQLYSEVSKRSPNTDEGEYCSYQMCLALYRLGRFDACVNELFNFVRSYRDSQLAPNAMFWIGWVRFQQKRYDESIDNFNFLIDAYPNSGFIAKTHYAIGDAYYNQSKFENAIKAYRKVVEFFPSSSLAPESLNSIKQCLLLLGREQEALEIIDAYTGKNDDSPFVYDFRFDKAKIQRESGQFKEAINEYQSLIKKFPKRKENAEAIYWIGRSYISMSETDQAISAFNELLEKFPKSDYASKGLLDLGMMYKNFNDVAASDSVLLFLEDTFPESQEAPQAGFERALMAYNLGDTTKSIDLYKHVANDYENNDFSIESRYRLGLYFRKNGEFDSARTEFGKLALNEFDLNRAAEAQYTIGELYKNEKMNDLAIQSFEIVREKYSGYEDWYSLSLLNLGELYENDDQWIKAREVYNILLELRPEDDFGKTAERRMKRVMKNLE